MLTMCQIYSLPLASSLSSFPSFSFWLQKGIPFLIFYPTRRLITPYLWSELGSPSIAYCTEWAIKNRPPTCQLIMFSNSNVYLKWITLKHNQFWVICANFVQVFSIICKWDKINESNPTLQETQVPWASLDQQLINKAIDQWQPRFKTVVKIHRGHIEQHLPEVITACSPSLP